MSEDREWVIDLLWSTGWHGVTENYIIYLYNNWAFTNQMAFKETENTVTMMPRSMPELLKVVKYRERDEKAVRVYGEDVLNMRFRNVNTGEVIPGEIFGF